MNTKRIALQACLALALGQALSPQAGFQHLIQIEPPGRVR